MRPLAALLVLAALAAPARAGADASLKRTVDDFAAALVAGDAAKARTFVATAAELVGKVRKLSGPAERKAFDAQNQDLVDDLVRELAEGRKQGSAIAAGTSEILDVRVLLPGDKLAVEMVVAQVRLGFTIDGKPRPLPFPLAVLKVGGRWRVSAKN